MAHILSISVFDNVADEKTIFVGDQSIYDNHLPVSGRILQVLLPGESSYTEIPFEQGKINSFNSMFLSKTECPEELSDGLYIFDYSVAPAKLVNVHFRYYRVVNMERKILALLASRFNSCYCGIDECGNVTIDKIENVCNHLWFMLQSVKIIGRNDLLGNESNKMYQDVVNKFNKLLKTIQ